MACSSYSEQWPIPICAISTPSWRSPAPAISGGRRSKFACRCRALASGCGTGGAPRRPPDEPHHPQRRADRGGRAAAVARRRRRCATSAMPWIRSGACARSPQAACASTRRRRRSTSCWRRWSGRFSRPSAGRSRHRLREWFRRHRQRGLRCRRALWRAPRAGHGGDPAERSAELCRRRFARLPRAPRQAEASEGSARP